MSATKTFSVLVVDDSAYARRTFSRLVEALPGVELAGTASDGVAAIREIRRLSPDLVLLDLEMPELDGFGVLRAIRELEKPPAVIIISAASSASNVVKSLELGALDFIAKPSHEASPELARLVAELEPRIAAVRAGARFRRAAEFDGEATGQIGAATKTAAANTPATRVVVIGASTGGPGALLEILCALPPSFGAAIAVALHMPAGFTAAFADRIARRGHLPAFEVTRGATLLSGTIAICPGAFHLTLEHGADGIRCALTPSAGEPWVPSVDRLFASAAALGANALGVVLTGMGSDGAAGALAMRAAGARVLVESADTAVVDGMPAAVRAAGAADGILRREEFALSLRTWGKR